MRIFKELQEHHENLLELQEDQEDILESVQEYIDQVRKASVNISSPEEREYIRANLRYWSSYIYELKGIYPDTELAPAAPQPLATFVMQNWMRFISFSLVLVLIILLLVSRSARTNLNSAIKEIGNAIDNVLVEQPSELVFAGQVEDEDGQLLNDYVVLLFQNGKEIIRTTSRKQESLLSDLGRMDGVFELRIPNAYKLNLADEFYNSNGTLISLNLISGLAETRILGIWLSKLKPNSLRVICLPDRQIELAIVVLGMTQKELPESIYSSNLKLEGGVLVLNTEERTDNSDTFTSDTLELQSIDGYCFQSNVQFTVLPSEAEGVGWNLQMTGYYGNRWDVWERFISRRVPGMDWETFEYLVLLYNPQLEADGFIFYPDKKYLLPFNQ